MRDIVIKISNTGDVLSATAFNALNDEMENIVTSASISLDPNLGPDTNLNMLAQAMASYANVGKTYSDNGSADDYVTTLTSALKLVAEIYDGLVVSFKAENSNTGASDLVGESFTRSDGSVLSALDILEDDYIIGYWNDDESRFEIVYYKPFASSDQVESHALADRLISPASLKVVEDKFYPTGIIRESPPNVDIFGYKDCNFQELSRTTYAVLFALIGTTFGVGDGSTTFNVPNIIVPMLIIDQTAPNEDWSGVDVNRSNKDIFICSSASDEIYKKTGGVGSWVDQSAPAQSWRDIAVNPDNDDVWACDSGGSIYKRTGGVGSWVDQSAPSTTWMAIAVNSDNGDVWSGGPVGNIYKRTGGVGAWVNQSAPTESWRGIAVNSSNGDVWICASDGEIYKRTGGVGSWVDQSAPTEIWTGIAVNPDNGDVWVCELGGQIYRNLGGTNTFESVLSEANTWSGISIYSPEETLYVSESTPGNDIFKMIPQKNIIKT